jgi:cbb3-type cytochrome oxidase maturation protein
MNIIYLMVLCSISIGVAFLLVFVWWVKSGQSDDLETPAHRILFDDHKTQNKINP